MRPRCLTGRSFVAIVWCGLSGRDRRGREGRDGRRRRDRSWRWRGRRRRCEQRGRHRCRRRRWCPSHWCPSHWCTSGSRSGGRYRSRGWCQSRNGLSCRRRRQRMGEGSVGRMMLRALGMDSGPAFPAQVPQPPEAVAAFERYVQSSGSLEWVDWDQSVLVGLEGAQNPLPLTRCAVARPGWAWQAV